MNKHFYVNVASLMSIICLPKPRKKLYDSDGKELPVLSFEVGVEV